MKPAQGPDGPIPSTMSIVIRFKASDTEFLQEGRLAANSRPGDDLFPPPVGKVVIGNPLAMRDVTMMDHPIWVQAATFGELAQSYPAGAGNVEGYTVVHCRVEETGELSECQIIKETPEKLGFKAAALSLARKFRILPTLARTPTKTPLWVDLPIRFPAPGGKAPPAVNAPVWLVQFDPNEAPRVFPPAAIARGLTTGIGVARCIVAPDGGLTGCLPGVAEPDGAGFSEAAVTLASVMKMNLWSADAAPVVGAVAIIRIRLNLKEQ